MKKEYEVPKAERMEFDYSEAVLASDGACVEGGSFSHTGKGCNNIDDTYAADVNE